MDERIMKKLLIAAALGLCAAPAADAQVVGSGVVGSANWTPAQVSVAATATLVSAGRVGRNAVTVENLGTTAVYCGPTSSVTTSNGALVPGAAGASLTLPTQAPVYCIVATGTQSVAEFETY